MCIGCISLLHLLHIVLSLQYLTINLSHDLTKGLMEFCTEARPVTYENFLFFGVSVFTSMMTKSS